MFNYPMLTVPMEEPPLKADVKCGRAALKAGVRRGGTTPNVGATVEEPAFRPALGP
jgi:hypothetical protein